MKKMVRVLIVALSLVLIFTSVYAEEAELKAKDFRQVWLEDEFEARFGYLPEVKDLGESLGVNVPRRGYYMEISKENFWDYIDVVLQNEDFQLLFWEFPVDGSIYWEIPELDLIEVEIPGAEIEFQEGMAMLKVDNQVFEYQLEEGELIEKNGKSLVDGHILTKLYFQWKDWKEEYRFLDDLREYGELVENPEE